MVLLDKNGNLRFNSIQKIRIENDYGYIILGAKYITKEMIAIVKEYDPYASWVQDDWKESRIASEKSIDTITSLKAKGVLVLEFVQIPCSAYPDGYINDLINSKIKPFNSGKASKDNRYKFIDEEGNILMQLESTNPFDAEKELNATGSLVDVRIDEYNKTLVLIKPEMPFVESELFDFDRTLESV